MQFFSEFHNRFSSLEMRFRSNKQMTPLTWASSCNRLRYIEFLVHHGATVNELDHDGNTPLICAVSCGHMNVVAFLVNAGADINMHRMDSWTPLMLAIKYQHIDIVNFLINAGADLEAELLNGWTALRLAFYYRNLHLVHHLIAHGASFERFMHDIHGIDIQASFFSNIVALSYGTKNVEQLLKDDPTCLNHVNVFGQTPLMRAVVNGSFEAVRWLLAQNAEVNIIAEHGFTALYFAVRGYVTHKKNPRVSVHYADMIQEIQAVRRTNIVDVQTQELLNKHTSAGTIDELLDDNNSSYLLK